MMKYVDYFAAPHFSSLGDDWLYKARLLVSIILTYMVVISLFGLFFALFPGTPLAERLAGLIPVTILGLSFVGVLFLLRIRGMFRFCAHTIIGATYTGIAAGIYMTGGPVDTPSGAMLLLPVFLAFSMLSMQEGFIWAGIVLTVSIAGMVATFAGYQFPMVTAEDRMQLTRAFNWVMAYLALVSLMFVYQMMNNRLRKERDVERERYRHVIDVAGKSLDLHETADALNVAGQDLLDAAISQKSAIEQLATTTEELAATAEQNRSLAHSARSAIQDTRRHLHEGAGDINLLSESMNTVKSSSDEIQTINNVVNDIAWQTNLLSLNAMIEASRAGEGNGGFKVVAQEVKKLAERSAGAADDINALLGKNFASVKRGVELSDNMEHRFQEIVAGVEPLAGAIQNVSDASGEQHEAVRQITQGLGDIDTAVGRNQQMAEQISRMVLQLRSSAAAMVEALETLKQKGH